MRRCLEFSHGLIVSTEWCVLPTHVYLLLRGVIETIFFDIA